MKYLQTYEKTTIRYKSGDYVIVDFDELKYDEECIIIGKLPDNTKYHVRTNIVDKYHEIRYDWVWYFQIERKLTQEEIEFYHIKREASKYNL